MNPSDWTVVFAADALEDLLLIEVHLAEAYSTFGESSIEAQRNAEARIEAIIANSTRIGTAPQRGLAHEDILPNLRHLTIDRAICWFVPEEQSREIRVLAVFFGSQDHQRKMLVRLLGRS